MLVRPICPIIGREKVHQEIPVATHLLEHEQLIHTSFGHASLDHSRAFQHIILASNKYRNGTTSIRDTSRLSDGNLQVVHQSSTRQRDIERAFAGVAYFDKLPAFAAVTRRFGNASSVSIGVLLPLLGRRNRWVCNCATDPKSATVQLEPTKHRK
jgi:hypothetical protein